MTTSEPFGAAVRWLLVVVATLGLLGSGQLAAAASVSVGDRHGTSSTPDHDLGLKTDWRLFETFAGAGPVTSEPPLRGKPHINDTSSNGVAPSGALDDLARVCRSFSADTEVLMADGTTRPISEIEPGDEVWALDPETSEAGARVVTAVWPHQDMLLEFSVEGGSVTTTEDHHFWNATDSEWQETENIDEGDYLLSSSGDLVEAGSLDWSTAHYADAYDLTVDDIHTYFVVSGDEQVLVHNTGCDEAAAAIQRNIGGDIHTFRPPEGVPFLGKYGLADEAWSHHTVVVNNGRVYDQFTGSGGMPIGDWKALWTDGAAIDFGF